MKRTLFLLACGWLVTAGGCGPSVTESFDEPSARIVMMDETALPDNVQEQLTQIDQKLARIDGQLDQRLTAIERRLLNLEQGGAASPLSAEESTLAPTAEDVVISESSPEATSSFDPSIAAIPTGQTGQDDVHEHVGPMLCAPCHLPQYRSWEQTKMAKTFEVLKPGVRAEAKLKANLDPNKDYTHDPTCVPCHVTGYGKQGGFVDIETTPHMAGVGCEMCHGPGGSYLEKGLKKNPEFKKADLVAEGFVGTVTVAQCQQCHNKNSPFVDDDYVFDFEANKEKGTHQHFPLQFQH